MEDTLNGLIEVCRNGEKGFTEAADMVTNAHLKSTFLKYAQQRAQFASQLQSEVTRLGGEPETSGTVAGALHRGWIDVKAALTGKDEHAVIAECERGEDFALDAYEDALDASLPADVKAIVEGQFAQVKEAHDTIRSLEIKTDK